MLIAFKAKGARAEGRSLISYGQSPLHTEAVVILALERRQREERKECTDLLGFHSSESTG